MKIQLIFPAIEHGVTTVHDKKSWARIIFGYPAITLPMLAALTPRKHTVEIINENYQDIDFDTDADIIGITSFTMTAPHVYEIADKFRENGKTVVLGGYHPSALPEEAEQHADAVVIGEAELSWPQLLQDFEKKKKIKPFYHAGTFDPAIIPPIRRDLIKPMPIVGAMQTTRGCPNRCEFCAITSFYNHGVKHRPIENVIEELKQMPNRVFLFHDPSLNIDMDYSRKLFKEMIKAKIRKAWIANGNINMLGRADDEYLKLAKEAGCIEWFVGFESVSQKNLNEIKKVCNKVAEFRRITQRVRKFGMAIQAGIIFGFDNDTPEIFDETIEQLYEWGVDAAEINILTPFPGTPLYDRLEREGRILTKDWSKYTQVDVVFQPKHMTPKELFEGARKVAKKFYSLTDVIKRMYGTFKISKSINMLHMHAAQFAYRRYYKRDYGF